MPFNIDKDSNGHFIQWGSHGKKYYFSNQAERAEAYQLAHRQQQAIVMSELARGERPH